MTVSTTGGGSVQSWSEYASQDGLEDVSGSDLSIPRLQIIHKEAVFKDSATGVKFETLNAVILGVVKQRIMWDKEVDEGDRPQCKSPNFELGYPQMRTDIDESKQFPWSQSNFSEGGVQLNDEGLIALPCEIVTSRSGPRREPSLSNLLVRNSGLCRCTITWMTMKTILLIQLLLVSSDLERSPQRLTPVHLRRSDSPCLP